MYETQARMVFFEKAKLKSLIFLIIDLNVTEQTEIIKEMSFNIENLKASVSRARFIFNVNSKHFFIGTKL